VQFFWPTLYIIDIFVLTLPADTRLTRPTYLQSVHDSKCSVVWSPLTDELEIVADRSLQEYRSVVHTVTQISDSTRNQQARITDMFQAKKTPCRSRYFDRTRVLPV